LITIKLLNLLMEILDHFGLINFVFESEIILLFFQLFV
jgi:hypothetical protein